MSQYKHIIAGIAFILAMMVCGVKAAPMHHYPTQIITPTHMAGKGHHSPTYHYPVHHHYHHYHHHHKQVPIYQNHP